jgi:hypothetical protein
VTSKRALLARKNAFFGKIVRYSILQLSDRHSRWAARSMRATMWVFEGPEFWCVEKRAWSPLCFFSEKVLGPLCGFWGN